uniref:G_PROTEIN_RECEP_F1_2 domain-containing protein n=1 Tax=Hymenolepis diminuta TaxID=6216 RepID=A0A0R3ST12_HYMDI
LPTVIPAETAEVLNVFERYQTATDFLRHLMPDAFTADRSITAFCVPIEALSLILTAAVLLFWSRNQRSFHWGENRRRDGLLRLIGLLYCPLLLLQITTSLLIDLDGIWELRILATSGARALCPLIHSFDASARVAVALTLILIAWRTHRLTSENSGIGSWQDTCCKFPCEMYPAYIGILLLSFVAGLVSVNFWQVTTLSTSHFTSGSSNDLQLICAPQDSYKLGLQVNFQKDAPSNLLYEWILNMAVFAPTTFIAIMCALVFSRRLLRLPPSSQVQGESMRKECLIRIQQDRLKLVIVICGLYGLANLPLVSVVFLGIMATPGPPDLPDHEILSDPIWERSLRHVFAVILCREIAETVTTALLFPILFTISSAFRRRFLVLLRLSPSSTYQESSLNYCKTNPCTCINRMCDFEPRKSSRETYTEAAAKAPIRWSWGKGWRQSFSPPGFSPPQESEREDPEYLDALMEQHNSVFAATATSTHESRTSNYYL